LFQNMETRENSIVLKNDIDFSRKGRACVVAKKRKLRGKMLSVLDLPQETDGIVPKVTLVGDSDLLIENHAGVLKCHPELIRLYTRQGTLSISGDNMELLELGKERVYIRGNICGVAFDGENKA